jgi:hypothetical protein
MVLEARDYGFIGLKLKGLIFHEGGNQRAHRKGISSAGNKIVKKCRMKANHLRIKEMIDSPRE